MPVPLSEALHDAATLAETKARSVRSLPRYIVQSALAGAYVGIAVVLLLSTAGPLAASDNPATKLVAGSVFGIALTLVVFAGAELFTGNAMVMLQGWWARRVKASDVGNVWLASLAGNLMGSAAFATVVHGTGILTGAPSGTMLGKTIAAKVALTGPQLLWRSVLCNALVCLGLWMASRTKSEAAKLVVLWWALFAFIASGFEHSIANMTIFGLGVLNGTTTVAEMVRNLAWTLPGNVIGGGLVIGLGYAWIGGRRPSMVEPEPIVGAVTVDVDRRLAGVGR
ncbi:MAG TPA: formate/nitrite transporter family protein [Acidimicrobiales bacterium]|nr:formate/nitrite transporter family protein [Acidimicrobiales bacterium]